MIEPKECCLLPAYDASHSCSTTTSIRLYVDWPNDYCSVVQYAVKPETLISAEKLLQHLATYLKIAQHKLKTTSV